MRGIARALVVMMCCLTAQNTHAQTVEHSSDTTRPKQIASLYRPRLKRPKPIRHEISAGVRLNSDGWSAFTDIGKVKSLDARRADMFYNVRILQVELTEKKSPKEEKLTSDGGSGSSSKYIYGKINNFYALKLGIGFRKLLVGKPDPGTVSMHWVGVIGASLGMLKPYYINVYSDPNAIKYSPATASDFLNQGLIEGSAGFSKGLGEMQFIPGGHIKSGIHFDFSANRKTVIAAETGFNFEYYASQIQMLANQPGTSYFFDIYLALQFGKRW